MENILSTEFVGALSRFLILLAVDWVIVETLYYRKSRRRDFYFTFILMSVAIFFLVYSMMGMERGKATMGVGLGLFGIFSIMRYRTDAMPVREMTYLFLLICLAVVHAMADKYTELAVIDLTALVVLAVCEAKLKPRPTKLIRYDRPELTKPERRQELMDDLSKRTGLNIVKVDVGGIDFLKDAVVLRVTYEDDQLQPKDIDSQYNVKKSQWREE